MKTLRILLFLSFLPLAVSSGADPVDSGLDLHTTHRIFDDGQGGSRCFERYIPSGSFELHLTELGDAPGAPRLTFHGPTEAAIEDHKRSFASLARSPTHVWVAIRVPGIYWFCVTARERFREREEDGPTDPFADPFDGKIEDPDEDEPDPDSLACGRRLDAEDPDEDEPDPDSLVSSRCRQLSAGVSG